MAERKFITNRQGVRISQSKVRTYRNLARRSNYMREQIKSQGDFFGFTTTGVSKFQSIKQLNAKIRQLQKRLAYGRQGYINYRQNIMKDNYVKSLYNIYGEQAFEYIDKIENMNNEDFYNLYKSHELPQVFAWDSDPDIAEFWGKTQSQLDLVFSKNA